MANFNTEREGQLDFYSAFLPMIDPALQMDDVLADDHDGVLNGNLLEFKLRIGDLNAALFQCVKYLSALRIKGKPVPANIVMVDLNGEVAYLFKSNDYLTDIEKVYTGGASKANTGFIGQPYIEKFAYGADPLAAARLINSLREKGFIRIHIDENCIVGWATAYYRAVPNARKEDFLGDDTGRHKTIGEIRKPTVFSDFIYPYTGKTNVRFQYLMDKLNDTLQKKNLGAFYTPELYARKSHELLRQAIARVPAGNDYIILDRCAGTGNLEKDLTDEELSHCILSTVEYYEYKVMQEILGSKVRAMIPPPEEADTFQVGLVKGADALSKEYIENPILRQYIDDPKCTIILFENPPYAEAHGSEKKMSGSWKGSFLHKEMKSAIKGSTSDDLGNVFIWSAFQYYLRQPTDSYVVYSPAKYWKAQHLVNKTFVNGFAFNRRYFHTNIDACILCVLWANIDDFTTEGFAVRGYDIDSSGSLMDAGLLSVDRIHQNYSQRYYDKRKFPGDTAGIASFSDGLEVKTRLSLNPIYNVNIIGYLAPKGSGFDKPDLNCTLTTCGFYNAHGFYLRRDHYLAKLPMFCASRYITYNRAWTERTRIMKSADGADRYHADVASGKLDQWLLKCLLFTCVEMQNHMRTFTGSDGRFYRNELCLDTTNGDTVAAADLRKLAADDAEKGVLNQWEILLNAAKKTEEYDPALTYGVYQIFAEIDTSYKDEDGSTVWNNSEVHSALQTLKTLVKAYYNREIVPTLFEYEFLK